MSIPEGLIVAAAVPAVAISMVLSHRKAVDQLREWAERNHFQLTRHSYVALPLPWQPFFWRSREGHIFFVAIVDDYGAARTGYVLCPPNWWIKKGRIEVRWDR